MSKRQLIDAIRQLNFTAQATFLGQFAEEELAAYLQRLQSAATHQLRIHTVCRRRERRAAS